MKEIDFANHHVRALQDALLLGGRAQLVEAAHDVLRFLERRLTQRAKVGCHHCGEGEIGEPCLWCGLTRATESERPQDAEALRARQ